MELIKALYSSFGVFNSTLTSEIALINVNGGMFNPPYEGGFHVLLLYGFFFKLDHLALNITNPPLRVHPFFNLQTKTI